MTTPEPGATPEGPRPHLGPLLAERAVYEEFDPVLGRRLWGRHVDPATDTDLVHHWMHKPHVVEFWAMDWSRALIRDYLQRHYEDPTRTAYLGFVDDEPVGYMEVYDPAHDVLGAHYEVLPGDLGAHVLIGEEEHLGRSSVSLGLAVNRFLFRRPEVRRLVGEPDVRNHQFLSLLAFLGFAKVGELDLPGKRAAFMVCDRRTFERLTSRRARVEVRRVNAAAPAALALVGVTARYGSRVALDDVSLEVLPGTITAVLGPNGAGKSTLVGLAAGLRAPDAGTVQVVGGDPRSRAGRRGRRVGLAPQDLGLYPGLTVAQNLAGFGEAAGLSAHDARRRAAEVAEPFVLAHLLDRPAGQLSGGEQRRLHAAVAVVHRPALVLLDEPTAGADVQTRDALLAVVRDLTADGTAVLYTTHYLPEVERLDAAVVVLEQGRVVAQGSLATLVGAHALGALVLRFDGAVPLGALPADVEVVVDGASVRLVCAQPELRLAGVLAALGDDVARLQAVELVPPSLEAVYLALTGRRHAVGAA